MSKSTNDKIRDILLTYSPLPLKTDYRKAHKKLTKLIKETLQECIGEEEPSSDKDIMEKQYEYGWIDGRNQLRQEALTKLEEMMK